MTDPRMSPLVIMVFYMQGCGHCDEYLPRFRRLAAAYKHCFPIYEIDCNDPRLTGIADKFRVSATPTTVVAVRPYGSKAFSGAISDSEIQGLLARAAYHAGCRA